MTLLAQFWQLILSGLTTGGIYALIAMGFVLIYNVTGILNFAQGEFVMLGAMLAITFFGAGLPLPLATGGAVLSVVLVGALVQRLALYPARRASIIAQIIITIGVSISIRGVALLLWGTDPRPLPSFSAGGPLSLLGAVVVRQSLWVMGAAGLSVLALYLFFEHTVAGKAFRACIINRLAARLMGISPERMALLAFAASAGLGALGGVVVAPITLGTYDMGLMLGLKGFVAAVLGGLTNAQGAILGGFLLGVVEALGAGLIHSGYRDGISFFILLLVLLVKPSGLLGLVDTKRV